jgi:hypothetical protein
MPGEFLNCEDVEIFHDLTSENDESDSLCLRCWEDFLAASTDDPMPTFGSSNGPFELEGFHSDITPFELAAQFNPQTERGDSSDHGKSSSDEDEDEDDQTCHQRHT